ncbi:MAG: hypothetical protein JWP15_2634, partial [Alphaproteobacteria bacterium]|nr:hypothetical protein [Alphaproteobacteria bacterium]
GHRPDIADLAAEEGEDGHILQLVLLNQPIRTLPSLSK